MDGAGASNNTYTLDIASPVQVTIAQQSYNFTSPGGSDVGTTTYITPIVVTGIVGGNSVSCSGCPTSVTATVSPMLFGANAQGLAAGISTRPTPDIYGEIPGERTSSVQVYQSAPSTPPL